MLIVNFSILIPFAYINIEINSLSGTIPSEAGNLTKLKVLNAASNQLNGLLPSQIQNLINLNQLDLGTRL